MRLRHRRYCALHCCGCRFVSHERSCAGRPHSVIPSIAVVRVRRSVHPPGIQAVSPADQTKIDRFTIGRGDHRRCLAVRPRTGTWLPRRPPESGMATMPRRHCCRGTPSSDPAGQAHVRSARCATCPASPPGLLPCPCLFTSRRSSHLTTGESGRSSYQRSPPAEAADRGMTSLCNRPYPVRDCALGYFLLDTPTPHSGRDTPRSQPCSAAGRQWLNTLTGCRYQCRRRYCALSAVVELVTPTRTGVGGRPWRHQLDAAHVGQSGTLKSGPVKVLRSTRATESVSPLSSSVDGTRQVSASPWFVLPRRTAARQGSLGCPPPRRDPQRGTSWRGDPSVRLPPSPRVAPPQQVMSSAHQMLECGEIDQ